MDTRAASGLGGGIFLGVVGAILYYAVSADISGIDINLVGVIFMVAGAILVALGLMSAFSAGSPRTTIRETEERVDPAGGRRRIEEQRTA